MRLPTWGRCVPLAEIAPRPEVFVRFAVTDQDGVAQYVDAVDWTSALGKAVGRSGPEVQLSRLVCRSTPDGAIMVDEKGGRHWILRPTDEDGVLVIASARSGGPSSSTYSDQDESIGDDMSDEFIATTPAPVFVMPGSRLEPPPSSPDSLAERLFDLSAELASASPHEAASRALEVLQQIVPCEAMSVLNARAEYRRLGFLAVQGPVANRLRGRSVAYGEGLVGLCHLLVTSILVDDVAQDWRHSKALDRETGFRTRGALCVPVPDGIGGAWGVIQLLNPPGAGFSSEAVDAADAVANMLSGVVRGS